MIYSSAIEIAQSALVAIGDQQITSLEDNSVPAQIIKLKYEGIVCKRLSMFSWSFASMPVTLTYQNENGTEPLKYCYVLPIKALRIQWIGIEGRRLDRWVIRDGKIYTDYYSDKLEAIILYRAKEGDWSPDFSECMVKEIEALFIRSLRRDAEIGRLIDRDVEILYRNAIAADKRQQPGIFANVEGRLINAHRGT